MPYHREQCFDNESISEHIFRTEKKINLNLMPFSSYALSSEKRGKGSAFLQCFSTSSQSLAGK